MNTITLIRSRLFFNDEPIGITWYFSDLFSEFMYDDEGKVLWPVYLQYFFSMLENEDECFDEEASMLLSYTLCESTL